MQVSAVSIPAAWNTDPVLDPTMDAAELGHAVGLLDIEAPETPETPTLATDARKEPWAARLVGRVMAAEVAAQKRRFAALGFEERCIATTHGEVFFYDRPRAPGAVGPTWAFGHGFASQAVNWSAVLQALAPACARVVCMDFPGHGRSPAVPWGQPAIDTSTASCLEVMDHLTAEDDAQVVPVGISMGGLAATVYATERPLQTAGAVLISPAGAPMYEESLNSLLTNFSPQTYSEARRTVELFMPHASFKPVMAWGMLHLLSNPYSRRLLEEFRTFNYFSAARLQGLPQRTLLLWGSEDTVIPSECRDHFFAHVPAGAELCHVQGWDHFVTMGQSKALAARLLEWGKQHRLLTQKTPGGIQQNNLPG